MIPKVKDITARLNNLNTRRSNLGLSKILSQAPPSKGNQPRLQPTSVMDEAVEYVGRHKEKQKMIELLKGNNSDGFSVLSIVVMGGMGKTTLAQLVYNDATINESFDLKAWVCVSDNFDAIAITKAILQSITSESCDYSNMDLLQVKLKEKLSGKSFLLVLDDIWNEKYNDWTILRSPFGAGTNIIVTTRLQIVSSMVKPLKAFHLDKLSDDDCLSIFTQHALNARNFDEHRQFKEIGEKIVRRCNGLPLAAKAIGSLLRTVIYHGEWERIYESEIWDLPEERCGIIPALRLSYHHLPSYLKRCSAYCSILPKDYEFKEEEIILLWRAEGLLQQKAMPQIKDLGNQYFQDLVSRSFFQTSSRDKSRFVMHDLINDLAQVVAGEICSKLEGDKQRKFSNRTRHSSYIVSRYDTVKKFEAFDQVKQLRTFLPLQLSRYWQLYLTNVVLVDLLPRLGYLRVLSLSGYKITELPDDVFENLKHLRCLNFSGTDIKYLPDSLCTLYHLETLLLKKCSKLRRLPSKMGNLVNLHYLDIRGANSIERIPFRIDKLTNLQRLSNFIIGEGDGCHIRDLKYLSNLKGDFRLSGLENVNGEDAGEAKLNEKQGIHRLVLEWGQDIKKDTRKREVEEWVLDSLHPSKKLEQLVIENYGGAKFSTWIADSSFKNMLSLKLHNCKNCKSLPSIGRLLLLKDLSISGLGQVNKIGAELFGENQSNAFASLESLHFDNMLNWEEWDLCEDVEIILYLSIGQVKLILHPSKKLEQLVIQNYGGAKFSTWIADPSFKNMLSLELHDCKNCKSLPPIGRLLLKDLSISGLDQVHKIGAELFGENQSNGFASLESLCFGNMLNWEEWDLCEDDEQVSKFPSLHFLSISGCPLLLGSFPLLCELSVNGCEELVDEGSLPVQKVNFLKHVSLSNISKFNISAERIMLRFANFETFNIYGWKQLGSLSQIGLRLIGHRFITIRDCPQLVSLETEEEILQLDKIPGVESLEIGNCERLNRLPKVLYAFPFITTIELEKCPGLVCFAESNFPPALKELRIVNCVNLQYLVDEKENNNKSMSSNTCLLEHLHIRSCLLDHLQEIRLSRCPNLVPFEESGLPTTNLRVFSIEECENFGLLPKCIHNFTSLRKLKVWNCSADISFPVEGFPTNLTSLAISKASKIYTSLVQWGFNRLTSLQELAISGEGCSSVMSFPEEGIGRMLPPSLRYICIRNFENLKFHLVSASYQDASLTSASVGCNHCDYIWMNHHKFSEHPLSFHAQTTSLGTMTDKRPNGTTGEVYVPLGDKPLKVVGIQRGQYQLMGTTSLVGRC
ncbi:hypothetical protein ES332_A11G374400v1 [Gossypium tomentosum]|uniref:Uncharacterized protein n=1 Tax=Gossypium tomentosum TaxID=34277 RepID=A0A5D2NLP2_GOSTO|nr:hypothetical protein ES332_A11G374400v1 [Gossypium tomentosum]